MTTKSRSMKIPLLPLLKLLPSLLSPSPLQKAVKPFASLLTAWGASGQGLWL